MAKKKGFYPWLKSIFCRNSTRGPEAVYAGPEYFRKDDPIAEEVYAGPEFFERTKNESPEEDAPLPPDEEAIPAPPEADKPVYAGPEYFERRPIMGKVYAGPGFYKAPKDVPPEDDGQTFEETEQPIDLVYAGPTIIENDPPKVILVKEMPPEEDGETEEEIPPEEDEKDINDLKALDGAEDEDLEDIELPPPPVITPPDPMTMCVYAGPEFFNGGQSAGAYAPPPEQPKPEIPNAEVTPEGMIKCPACGGFSSEGSKFCCECGMPFKTGE